MPVLFFSSRRPVFASIVLAAAATLTAMMVHADATPDKTQQRKKIVAGVALPGGPFGSIDSVTQRGTGFNVDLAQVLGCGLGVEVKTVQVQPSNRVQSLQQGRADVLVTTMKLNLEHAELFAYVPTPYYCVDGVVLIAQDSPVHQWSDLRGRDVYLLQGGSYAKPLVADIGATPKGFKGPTESLLVLRGNSYAAAVHDATLLQPLSRNNPEWKNYRIVSPDLTTSPTVIWTRKDENDTVATLGRIAQSWYRTGWLIGTGRKSGVLPPSSVLIGWRDKLKATHG